MMIEHQSSGFTPIKQGLFDICDGRPVLIGSRCVVCSEHYFPVQKTCSSCPSTELEQVSLGDSGTLWSWTIQGFLPKSPYRSDVKPEEFVPYGVGYIEMPCGVKVETRIRQNTPNQLEIGAPMTSYLEPLYTDEEGIQVSTYAFEIDRGES
ncbi:MAG: Zn-ribbon domain-containing OB-fold protein [Porticoccaceae bacterium]|jgi:uncharacterized OB-fold protein